MEEKKTLKPIWLWGAQKPIERNDNLTRYYSDIRRYDIVDSEEVKKLLEDYTKATGAKKDKLRTQIFNAHAKLVVTIARTYCNSTDSLNDLIEEGNIGLLYAIDKFDASKGASFSTCAVFYIRREIATFKRDHCSVVQQTNRSKTDNVARNLISQFMQKEERTPTTDELLEMYNNNRINKDKHISNPEDLVNVEYVYIDSLDGNHGEEFTNCQSYIDYSMSTASTNDYMKDVDKDDINEILGNLMTCLSPKEQLALRMMYGIETGFEESLPAIGDKLGCTSERARQLCVSAMDKLQKSVKYA